MKQISILAILGLFCSFLNAQKVPIKLNFNQDWYFNLEDDAKFNSTDYDHSNWRKLDVPHDWSIEGEYNKKNPMGGTCGYLPAGIGFYRKTIPVPEQWKGKVVNIRFDGVFMNSTVWANGKKLGTRPYGWSSFSYDISSVVNTSETITFAVRVDNDLQPSARWYTGSGIFTDTWIEILDPVHIERTGGVYITTTKNKVNVVTELINLKNKNVKGLLKTYILDAQGNIITQTSNKVKIKSNNKTSLKQDLTIEKAQFWSPESPYLYTLVSEVWTKTEQLDLVKTRFGVRDVEWIPETGMWLNGKNVKLQGVCNHQDAGALGTAIPDKILRFRIQQLKDMGVNAIRTSHNPQTPKFYDMCDEIGVLVMDEIFDGWKKKAKNDYGAHYFTEWWKKDLSDWIKRDRNHPSIVIYSVGNETGGKVGKDIVEECHKLDPTRPVTSGHSGSQFMDVHGVNGASERIGFIDNVHRDKVFIGTENTHTWQVRGYYRTQTWYRDGAHKKGISLSPDLTEKEIFFNDFMTDEDRTIKKMVFNSSYDNAYVRLNSRGNIEQIRDIPHYAGSFRWTGYDYIGEASYVHGGWPFKAFMGGAIDLANFEKDLFYLYQSQWTEEPMAHILPHWTHPKLQIGTQVPVWVYSNCDEVELFINGKSLGKKVPGKTRHDMQCEWLVPYELGTLKAVAYKDCKAVVVKHISSANYPTQNALSIDGEGLKTHGKDIVQVRVTTQDSLGVMYPHGENRTYFKLFGPAKIRALDNGSPIDVEKHYGVDNRIAFYGLTRAYIQSTGEKGDINLLASAILGEKKQITSNRVSIDTKILNLRGKLFAPKIEVYYTTDGSRPTKQSMRYKGSFAVNLGTTVKALIVVNNQEVQLLTERFASDVGFVWNAPTNASKKDSGGEQAEVASFKGASVSTQGMGFNGKGFLDFGNSKHGYVEWYQENDGDAGQETLNIRYSCKAAKSKGRMLKLIVNDKVIHSKLLLPNTNSWGKQWKTISVKINLNRGANTIRLQNIGNGGAYIDEISFGAHKSK